MNTLHVSVANKIATYALRDGTIVCGNSDYVIKFTFDSEWDAYEVKTARFIWNGKYFDQEFTGNECSVPVIRDTTKLSIGVYAGDLSTTTPAVIECVKSILCESTSPQPEFGQSYTTEAQRAAEDAKGYAEDATSAWLDAGTASTNAKTYANEARLAAEEAKTVGGGSRTYVVDTLEEFLDTLVTGNICPDCKLDNLALQNGDQVIIKTGNHPSFWFEKEGEPVDYSYNGVVHSLGVWEGLGYNCLGTFHSSSEFLQMAGKMDKLENVSGSEVAYVQKTNNEVIHRQVADSPAPFSIPRRTEEGAVCTVNPTEENHAVNLEYFNEKMGDVETALDSIIAIQESLIGGGTE